MSAPIKLVVVPLRGTHLADATSDVAYCRTDVRGGVSFVFEPGMVFGEHGDDCRTCVRAWQAMGGAK